MLKVRDTGLRALEISDLSLLQTWRNNAEMRRYYREYRELNLFDQERWFNTICCGNPQFCMFGIVALQTTTIGGAKVSAGELIGVCGLTNIHWILRSAEISFYIGAGDTYIDSVHAPDAVNLMCDYAFNTLNLHKIWAEIYDFDTSKKKLFEDIGMHKDGILRDNAYDDGKYHNSLVYSLLRAEYSPAHRL